MSVRRDLALAATLVGGFAAACTDRSAVAPSAVALPTSPGAVTALVTCEVTVRAATLSCAQTTAAPTSGIRAGKSGIDRDYVTLGGQGTYVLFSSSNPQYDGVSAFTVGVTVTNLLAQPMNTAIATVPYTPADTGGVKAFFWSGPTATGGSGTVTVANPDGTGTFTQTNQPFFKYSSGAVLLPGAPSEGKIWQFDVPNTVTTFAFTVGVYTQIPTATLSPLSFYVLNTNHVTVYGGENNDMLPTALFTSSYLSAATGSQGIALDAAGHIYVSSAYDSAFSFADIAIYAPPPPGASIGTRLATIDGFRTGLNVPEGIAVDGSGDIYVANYVVPSITYYAAAGYTLGPNNVAPTDTIKGTATGLNSPTGLALSADLLYVANQGNSTITLYYTTALGMPTNLPPIATIGGTLTLLHNPGGIAVDGAGNVYVTDPQGDSITVYAAPSFGSNNVAPRATIAGPNTGLNDPQGIALDPAGNIYVANELGGGSITVYAAGANGNEAPSATIAGGFTGLNSPRAIAF